MFNALFIGLVMSSALLLTILVAIIEEHLK